MWDLKQEKCSAKQNLLLLINTGKHFQAKRLAVAVGSAGGVLGKCKSLGQSQSVWKKRQHSDSASSAGAWSPGLTQEQGHGMLRTIFSRMIQHESVQEGETSIEKAGQSLAVRFRGRLWESQGRLGLIKGPPSIIQEVLASLRNKTIKVSIQTA